MRTIKNRLKKNLYGVLTAVLTTLFFIVGFFTLGSFSTTGEAYYLVEGTTAVFELEYRPGQTHIKEIYVNLGAVYAEKDSEVEISIKTSTSTTSSSSWTQVACLPVTQAGVNEEGLFNWSAAVTDLSKNVDVRRVSVSLTETAELNEIVLIANDGEKIQLKVAEYGNSGSEEDVKKVANAVDGQKNFSKKEGEYYRFTKEEGAYLSYLRNLALGSYYDGEAESVYSFAEDFGAVAVMAFAPSVAIFGESVFALRLPSLIATTLALIFLALFMDLLFKDKKYAFLSVCLLVLSGVAFSASRLGAPYSLVACAIVGATYFAYKFFSKGISSNRIFLDGANVLFASLLCAIAVSMEGVAIFPALGVFGVLGLGAIRQKKAHVYALERAESIGDEENKKIVRRNENITYSKKNRVLLGSVALGFGVSYFFLIFLSTILCHNAYARAYDEQVGLLGALFGNVCAGFRADALAELMQGGNSIAWFLPIANLKENLSLLSILNLIVAGVAFLSLTYCTVVVIKNRKVTDKITKRVSRIYSVLLVGATLVALSALVKGVGAVAGALAFYAFYYGFILLALYCFFERSKLIEKGL